MTQFTGYDILANHEQDLEHLRRTQEPFALGSAGSRKNESVDPRSNLKVEMQWSLSSCTGNAITTCMEALWGFQCGDFSKVKQLSRMYAYLKGQQVFGNFGKDAGCGIAAIVKAMLGGCCEESVFPYPSSYTTRIPAGADQNAVNRRILSHAMAEDFDQAVDAMDGCGVLDFGTIWTSAMHNFRGLVLDLQHVKEDGSRSGHSYAGVGFTKHQGQEHIIVANSHSERWAQGGYALMTKRAFQYLVGRPYSVIALLFSVSGAERKKNNIVNFQDWS